METAILNREMPEGRVCAPCGDALPTSVLGTLTFSVAEEVYDG